MDVERKKIITYAQAREDLFIASFFPDIKEGFYVDVGAYDPTKDSVTRYFYDRGWRGINIEPQKRYFNRLSAERPGDININVGVSDTKGMASIRQYAGGGLSTFSKDLKREYEKKLIDVPYVDVTSKVDTLANILDRHHKSGGVINFMKLDIEGFEYQALQANNWQKYRPELLCVEANHIAKDWHQLLDGVGYHKVFFDGLNEYFLSKEALYRLDLFDYPSMFLGADIEVITNSQAMREDKLAYEKDLLEKKMVRYQRRNANLKHAISQREYTIREFDISNRSIQYHIKRLIRLVARNVRSFVKRGEN